VNLELFKSSDGAYCMLALDHREALRNAFRSAGVEGVSAQQLLDVKRRIVAVLGERASGILLDYAAAGLRPPHAALLAPLEAQGHEPLGGARLNRLEFSAADAVRVGADGCKLLLWYRADHHESSMRQAELVAGAVEDCHRAGLPLILEPLVYKLAGESDKAYAEVFGDLVVEAARELHVCDLLKLQYPGDKAVERATAAAAPLEWALLGGSEVAGETFAEQLTVACRAGAAGFIAGRAIWGGCLSLPPEEQERWLRREARPLFDRLIAIAHEERLESRPEGAEEA
jgi:tagatose-1,6-bisphosphate aldolase